MKQFTTGEYRVAELASRAALDWTGELLVPHPHELVFFVLVGLVHGEAAEFVGHFE